MLRRTFSVDEANAALPEVRRLTERIVERSRRLPELHEELRIRTYRAHRSGALADGQQAVTFAAADLRRAESDLADSLRDLGRAGVDLKDAMEGVVDFPSIREGRVIELCWRVGEPEVAHWHPVGGGFRSRQRLP
jgi:hypothetical protein